MKVSGPGVRAGVRERTGDPMRSLLCIVFACGSALAGAWPKVVARDAETGDRLKIRALGYERGRHVYARLEHERFKSTDTPQRGDRLYVYCRGYELAEIVLDGTGAISVPLRRIAKPGVIRIESAAKPEYPIKMSVLLKLKDRPRIGPVEDDWKTTVTGTRCAIAVPSGMIAACFLTTEHGIVSPLHPSVPAGREVAVRYHPPRELEVLRSPDTPEFVSALILCRPDRHWAPQVTPGRIAAWRWAMGRTYWLSREFAGRSTRVRVSPDVPFHLFMQNRQGTVYRYVGPGQTRVDLRAPLHLRTLSRRPVIDGKPARAGTWLAPGRLDLFTIADVASLRKWFPQCAQRLGEVKAKFEPLRFPKCTSLTAWHPDTGLAHLAWARAGTPSGKTLRGRVRVVAPEGWRVAGHASLVPVWKSNVKTVPPDSLLRRDFDNGEVVFPGLAAAHYTLVVRAAFEKADGTDRTPPVLTRRILDSIEVRPDSGEVVHTIPRPEKPAK